MKKMKVLLLVQVFMLVFACSGATGGNGSHELSITSEERAKFKYLDYLYNPVKGKSLNDEILTGAVYEKYPEEVQRMVNIMLRFPLHNNVDLTTAAIAKSESASGTSASSIEWLDNPWYNSTPSEIVEWIKQQGIDVLSDGLSEGLLAFLSSEEGQAYITYYMDEVQQRLEDMIDYGIDRLAEEYETEMAILLAEGGFIAISEGVMAGAATYAALTGALTMTINPLASVMTAVSMVQSYYQNKSLNAKLDAILNQLKVIQQQLVVINSKLDMIDEKLNLLLGYTIDLATYEYYKDADNARRQLKVIQQMMSDFASGDQEQFKIQVRDFLTDPSQDGYEYMMQSAFDAANHTQQWRLDNGLVQKAEVPGIMFYKKKLSYSLTNGFRQYQSERLIEKSLDLDVFPSYFSSIVNNEKIAINYRDIVLLINLSKARFDLAELVYSGDTLLDYRKNLARKDLQNIFLKIDTVIDNVFSEFTQRLRDTCQYSYPDYNEDVFYSYHINVENIGDFFGKAQTVNDLQIGIGDIGLYLVADVNEFNNKIYYTMTACPYVGEKMNNKYVDWGEYGTTYFVQDIDTFNTHLQNIMQLKYMEAYDDEFIEHVTRSKALVAAWIITLNAHMKAGEGL